MPTPLTAHAALIDLMSYLTDCYADPENNEADRENLHQDRKALARMEQRYFLDGDHDDEYTRGGVIP